MNATELSQIVHPPEEDTPELRALIELAADEDPDPPLSRVLQLKLSAGRFVHGLGIHTWLRWMQYDRASNRLIDTGGQICAWCPKAKLP